jgi:hypothetical protein
MQDDLVFADVAGHIVIDVEATRAAEKRDAGPARAPENARAKAPSRAE